MATAKPNLIINAPCASDDTLPPHPMTERESARQNLWRSLVTRSQARIEHDYDAGHLGRVRDFSTLHDFVDANAYAVDLYDEEEKELTEFNAALLALYPEHAACEDTCCDHGVAVLNDVSSAVDRWLLGGALVNRAPAAALKDTAAERVREHLNESGRLLACRIATDSRHQDKITTAAAVAAAVAAHNAASFLVIDAAAIAERVRWELACLGWTVME